MIYILKDGEDPIIISGNRSKFQIPQSKDNTWSGFLTGSSWKTIINGEESDIFQWGRGGSNQDIRFLATSKALKYINSRVAPDISEDDTYIIYEIKLDTRNGVETLIFDIETTTSPIEIDLESDIDIDKETIKNNISGLISYE